jgi:ferritin-like metal-binding protein YciE
MPKKNTSTEKARTPQSKSVAGEAVQPRPIMELFVSNLQDMYWAENHLVKSLPKMKGESSLKELQQAIADHLDVTKVQVARLEKVFGMLGSDIRARKCDAMEGLTLEGEGTIEDTLPGSDVRNLGINFSCQKVEHYEIAAYTALVALANSLGLPDAAELLNASLMEEQESLDLLSAMSTEMMAEPS